MALKKKKRRKSSHRFVPLLSGKSNFSVIEAYKTIRTNLMFATQKKDCNCVIITSTVPNEGKSTNCCNLAITMAQTKSRVLIIDCDLRKPSIHKFFKVQGIPGLSEALAGMNDVADVVRHTEYGNLDIICGGTIPPNPAELLSSSVMDKLLAAASKVYNYILLDTPPINLVSDALALSEKTDGVVLVTRQGETTHPELAHALNSLEFAHAKVLGIILNGVEMGGKYGHYRYGKKKYGYGKHGYGDYADYYKQNSNGEQL